MLTVIMLLGEVVWIPSHRQCRNVFMRVIGVRDLALPVVDGDPVNKPTCL